VCLWSLIRRQTRGAKTVPTRSAQRACERASSCLRVRLRDTGGVFPETEAARNVSRVRVTRAVRSDPASPRRDFE